MAWNEVNKVEQRRAFIRELEEGYRNFSELCREFGISRETGYKWRRRYEEGGFPGLNDRSSRPKHFRDPVPGDVVADIIQVRIEHPGWGGTKIRKYMKYQGYSNTLPSGRTIDRLLKRVGLVRSKSSYKRVVYRQEEVVKPTKCNMVWTVDFKGWWNTQNGKRCEPLTIRDEYSKFILSIQALSGTAQKPVIEAFKVAFEKYGLPDYIRSDNGVPFSCTRSLHGLTKLAAWWIKLGITPNRIPPASPQYNGGHERMHKDIKRELQMNPALNLQREQKRFDAWRHEFNHIRPHQALNDYPPSTVYKRSRRSYKSPMEYVYPAGCEYRKVCADGQLFWKNKRVLVTKALTGEFLGIDTIDKDIHRVWFRDFYIGIIDMKNHKKVIPDMEFKQK